MASICHRTAGLQRLAIHEAVVVERLRMGKDGLWAAQVQDKQVVSPAVR